MDAKEIAEKIQISDWLRDATLLATDYLRLRAENEALMAELGGIRKDHCMPEILDTRVFLRETVDIHERQIAGLTRQRDVRAEAAGRERFQNRVAPWMQECFGPEISADREERCHRFLEEAVELVQSLGTTASECHQLISYVYGRPAGDTPQEVGGVMVTLAALCLATGMDMHSCGETELSRIWGKVEKIRAKQAAKPKHSPLPEHKKEGELERQNAAMREGLNNAPHGHYCATRLTREQPCDCWKSRTLAALQPAPEPSSPNSPDSPILLK